MDLKKREAMGNWAEAITRLNAAENRYNELYWWQFCARRRHWDHLAVLREECRIASEAYRAIERSEREALAE